MFIDLLAGENKPKNNIPEYFAFLRRRRLSGEISIDTLYEHYCRVIESYATENIKKIESLQVFADYIKDESGFPFRFKDECGVLKILVTIK